MEIFFPSLPGLAASFHVMPALSQLSITLYLLGYGLSQLIYGPLSDIHGRRPLLLLGFSVFLIGTILAVLSPNIETLIFSRLLQGLGVGAGATLSRVLLRDLYHGNEMAKVSSYITIGISTVSVLSPAIGGYIQGHYGYAGNLWLMLIYGIVVLVVIYLFLPETNTEPNNNLYSKNLLLSIKTILSNRVFIINVFCAGLSLSILIAYGTINPFILQIIFHLSPFKYGLLTMIIATGEILGTVINSRLVEKLGTTYMNNLAYGLVTASGILLLVFFLLGDISIPTVIICSFFSMMSIGVILPNVSANAFSEFKVNIGLVGAVYGFLQITITSAFSYAISLFQFNSIPALIGSFLLIGIACLIASKYKNTSQPCF